MAAGMVLSHTRCASASLRQGAFLASLYYRCGSWKSAARAVAPPTCSVEATEQEQRTFLAMHVAVALLPCVLEVLEANEREVRWQQQ